METTRRWIIRLPAHVPEAIKKLPADGLPQELSPFIHRIGELQLIRRCLTVDPPCRCVERYLFVDPTIPSEMAFLDSFNENLGKLDALTESRLRGTEILLEGHAGTRIYLEPEETHPPNASTPDPYLEEQDYLDEAPVGVGIRAFHNIAPQRRPEVKLVDVEQGWHIEHEEFAGRKDLQIDGVNHRFHGHGTSVLGVLLAREGNGVGGTGMAPDVNVHLVSQFRKGPDKRLYYSTAEAICASLDDRHLSNGDILLLQAQHRDEKTGVFLPVEADEAVRCAIECAVAKGVLVVEAAGNGGVYLDNLLVDGKRPFDPAHRSGAVLVAAATSGRRHEPLYYTNYGSSVRCYAWGEDVITCGDGETSQESDEYTPDFGGTSSAATIVAGVAALIQSVARGMEKPLSGQQLRELIESPEYGTPPAYGSPPIGVMPDLAKILARLKS